MTQCETLGSRAWVGLDEGERTHARYSWLSDDEGDVGRLDGRRQKVNTMN